MLHRVSLFVLLAGSLCLNSALATVFDDAARQAAAQSGEARRQAVTVLLKNIESNAQAPADDRIAGLWQAVRLAGDDPQMCNLVLETASSINDQRAYNVIHNYRWKLNRKQMKEVQERFTSRTGREAKPGGMSRGDQWEDKDGFTNRYQSADGKITVDVLGTPFNTYRARLRSPQPTSAAVDLLGFRKGDALELVGPGVSGVLQGGTLTLTAPAATLRPVALERTGWVERPKNAVVLLDEKTGLKHFRAPDGGDPVWKEVQKGVIEVGGGGGRKGSILTRDGFSDYRLYLEFCLPFTPNMLEQARGNSGVFLNNAYEVQILDSFGQDPADNYAGGIYKVAVPTQNMVAPPLRWQSYLIEFTSPRFNGAGKKTANARLTVWHNGVKIQDNIEVSGRTDGLKDPEQSGDQPILLQNHGDNVRYRNIWLEKL